MQLNPPSRISKLAVGSLDEFVFGHAPRPLVCGHGLSLGTGTVVPEINFTLPPMDINESTWPDVRQQYARIIKDVCQRAVDLGVPGLLVEFETLPPMTLRPDWGVEITSILASALSKVHDQHGLKCGLRLTPNDNRDHERPARMRQGDYWQGMCQLFSRAADAGADLLAIESTGGKEVSDQALMNCDLRALLFALGVLGARDMEFLWGHLVSVCHSSNILPSGDTACAFGNTAMVLAEQKLVPRLFAAVVRVATVPRSLVAYEMGAVGPSKDCAYEGPYMKAMAGVPISMEGRSAACAHLSPVGNISQALCDAWSNESVQNVRLLSTFAPTVSLEHLAYDCRLLNTASASSSASALQMRDWLVESDAALDPQAYVLRPDVVLKLAAQIVHEPTPYLRTRTAILACLEELARAQSQQQLRIAPREMRWLDSLRKDAEALPHEEQELITEMLAAPEASFLPAEYGL